jgi:hypothetical protein
MADDEVAYELGVDLNSTLTFSNGDINLTSYEDNLIQGVMNRLNTDLDELDLFYDEYGSILTRFLGWKTNDETLGFIEAEVENVLDNEERLINSNCTASYLGNGLVRLDLTLNPNETTDLTVNLVLTDTGVIEIETDEIIDDDGTMEE